MSGIGYFGPKRKPGYEEQPSINPSFLKLRLPFYHYPIEYQDFIQGMILACVPLGITAVMEASLNFPIEVSVLMVLLNNIFYLWHTSFGDPSVAGWITPGIPIYTAYYETFSKEIVGPTGVYIERTQALIAAQLILAVIFLVFGLTGLGTTFVEKIPTSITAGILLGSGIASVERIFNPTQPFVKTLPVSYLVSAALSLFLLFSKRAIAWRKRNKFLAWIGGFGIVPGFVIGYILGLITGEIKLNLGVVFKQVIIGMPFDRMIAEVSPFGIGWPSAIMFGSGFAVAIVAYIIAFGDFIVLKALIKQADEARPDEKVVVPIGRSHIICALRNFVEGIFLPYPPFLGPQWTGGQALVVQRYMHATPEQEYTYWGGATSIFWGMSFALALNPIVQIMLPAKNIGLGLTLLIQGYLCSYLAMEMCQNNIQRAIAGIMTGALIMANYVALWKPILGMYSSFFSAPAMGLLVGIILHVLVEREPGTEKGKKK